jgi:PAS domain S-box-containing protein
LAVAIAGGVYTWKWKILEDRIIVNAAFAHLFAVDPLSAATEGLPLDRFLRAMHEDDRPHILAAINRAIETGEEYLAEYRVHTATGEERWVTARGRVEYDVAGRPVAFPGALADITERKRAQEDRDRFFQLSLDMLAIISTDGYFLQASQAWTSTLGYTLEELTTQPYIEFVHPDDRAATLEEARKLTQGIQTIAFENRYRCRDGSYRWILWSVAPFLEQKLLYCVARDVTDRKRAEVEREQLLAREQAARETAEAANRVKDEFLAVLSHELRSPLNPILGWSKLLQSRKLDQQKTAHALETIERNAKLQVQLIDDLLDVARILRGKLSLNTVPVNLATSITAALETVRLAAEAKSIQIQTVLEPNVGEVLGDSGRLQQVVWNLVSNAVKFTSPEGRVDIRLESFDDCAQIQVSDTGKGISPDFLPYVFESFRQADNATTRQFGGLGLGLAIVRQIVELHGGTVQAASLGEGQGATFTIRLPLMPQQPQMLQEIRQAEPAPNLQGVKVLVVDDIADIREYVAFVLEQEGATVTSVSSAAEALSALTQVQPDVLVSDIGMAEVDGYMLMRQVRSLPPSQGGAIPALALTAYAGEMNEQQAIAAGFQRHLAKPVEPTVLLTVIAELVDSKN